MKNFLLKIMAIAIVTLSFSTEMKAQYVNQVGVKSDYVDKGKIYIGGAPLARQDAVEVLGEDLGQQYKNALIKKGASKTLLIAGASALAVGATLGIAYQVVDSNTTWEDREVKYASRALAGVGFLAIFAGGASMITGAVMSHSATKNINNIRNAYNKGLSEKELSYSVGFTGNGVGLSLRF